MKWWLLLCLAGLSAGTAVTAMPVTQPAGPDPLAREQELLAAQANQPLRTDAGVVAIAAAAVAASSPALLDLAKQPGAEFEAVLVKGELLHGSGPRAGNRAEQELFGATAKDGLISAEVKSVLKDMRGELHQLTGDHFRNAQAAGAAEQEQLNRRLDEAKSLRGEAHSASGQPISEEERRRGAWQVMLMTEQLIEEVKPWAITAAVLFVLFHLAQALSRKQAAAKLLRSKMSREVYSKTSSQALPQAAPTPTTPATPTTPTKGQRVRVRQRIRLTPSASSSSRRRFFS